jgi:hypothetical protein
LLRLARAVVTIENATSFSEFVAIRPNNVLAIFTSDFASPTIIGLLKILMRRILLFRSITGDLDVGGLRILAHLQNHLGKVTPIAMDVETFAQFQTHAQKLNAKEHDALILLQSHALLTDCSKVIQSMLAADRKLEQEAVGVERIVKVLAEFDLDGRGKL